MEDSPQNPTEAKNHPEGLHREERTLWRTSLAFMVLLAAALAAMSWNSIQNLADNLQLLPLAIFLVVLIFAYQTYQRVRDVSELRGRLAAMQAATITGTDSQEMVRILAESRENYRGLVDSMDAAVFTMGLDGRFRAANRKLIELLGRSYQEVVGHGIQEFLAEPTAEELAAGLKKFLEMREWSGMVRVKIATTERRHYLDCKLYPMIQGGTVVALTGIIQDVTAQREREQFFTTLFESLHEPIFVCTPEGRLLDGNSALAELLGCANPRELTTLNLASFCTTAELGTLFARGGDIHEQEIRLRRRDDSVAVCLISAKSQQMSDGSRRIQGILTDVTHRREMERKLEREREFREMLLSSFPDVILVMDSMGKCNFVSKNITEYFGIQPESFLGTRGERYVHLDDQGAVYGMLDDLLKGKRDKTSQEFRLKDAQEEWHPMLASASPLRDEKGRINGVTVSLRDISESKRVELQLIQSERMAAIGEMIDSFVHELNNPLTSIMGACELMKDDAPQAMKRNLTLMYQETQRASEIVRNMLMLSRPPQGTKGAVDLQELLERTIQMRQHALRKGRLNVDFVRHPKLPTVCGDPGQLMQVLLNLLINAEQATLATGREGTIRIRTGTSDSSKVWCRVQDDGAGIPAEVLPRIFEPFFSTKRPGRSTGLGLSISQSVANTHGGDIRLEEAPDGGTVAILTLPAYLDASGRPVVNDKAFPKPNGLPF